MAKSRNTSKAMKTLRTIGTIAVVGIAAAYFLRPYFQKDAPYQESPATERPAMTEAYVSPSLAAQTYTPTPTMEPTLEATVENAVSDTIIIGSFNIQILGESKAGKTDVMDALGKIVSQYDLVAIQEIRDSSSVNEIGKCSGIALTSLLDRIKSETGQDYGCIQGDRQGRSSSKEQYVFIFNPDVVSPVGEFGGAYTYRDENDIFEREPLIAQFRAGNFDFALANIHTKPDDARGEICALSDVIADAQSHYQNDEDVIVLGDFNADGSYFNESTTECLKGSPYNWVIGDSIDTNLAQSSNTYDRIVFKHEFGDEDFAGKAGAYYFDLEQDDTPFTRVELAPGLELKTISDHYPVWAIFYTIRDSD